MMSYMGPILPKGGMLTLTISLKEDSIYVGQDVLELLGRPRQIQMMINEKQKKLLLQACTVNDREAVVVPPQPALFFQMSGQSLLKKIRKLTDWNDDRARILYGQKVPGHAALVFDLDSAEITDFEEMYYAVDVANHPS